MRETAKYTGCMHSQLLTMRQPGLERIPKHIFDSAKSSLIKVSCGPPMPKYLYIKSIYIYKIYLFLNLINIVLM